MSIVRIRFVAHSFVCVYFYLITNSAIFDEIVSLWDCLFIFAFFCCCCCHFNRKLACPGHLFKSTYGSIYFRDTSNKLHRERDIHFRFMSFICLSELDLVTIVSVNHCTLVLANVLFPFSLNCKFNTQGHSFVWMVVCVQFIRMLQNCFAQFSESHRRDERRRIERNKYNVYW